MNVDSSTERDLATETPPSDSRHEPYTRRLPDDMARTFP